MCEKLQSSDWLGSTNGLECAGKVQMSSRDRRVNTTNYLVIVETTGKIRQKISSLDLRSSDGFGTAGGLERLDRLKKLDEPVRVHP